MTPSNGSAASPVSAFTSQPYTCSSGGTFQKGYTPVANSLPALFYGPNVAASAQTGPFINSSFPLLTVDTFHAGNGTMDTGLRLRQNWGSATIVTCNDNTAGGPGTTQSRIDWTLGTVAGQDTYRLGIFYKTPPAVPANTTVYINWSYH